MNKSQIYVVIKCTDWAFNMLVQVYCCCLCGGLIDIFTHFFNLKLMIPFYFWTLFCTDFTVQSARVYHATVCILKLADRKTYNCKKKKKENKSDLFFVGDKKIKLYYLKTLHYIRVLNDN